MDGEHPGDLERIAAALAGHPAVREAAVRARDGALVAYVVPEPQRPPAAGQPGGPIARWQSLWGQTYAERPGSGDPTLNLSGWNSSYTGKPIRRDEMKDWVERTVERILALGPRRLLEIGCGMGLLLFRIAPRVEAYWGVDFSPEALAYVGEHVTRLGLDQVELLQQSADGICDSGRLREAGPFDTVVVNSVVQYFPGPDYLLRVLEGALSVVAPGGRLFLGDLRSLPLLAAFHASVQMLQAEGDTPVAELRERVGRLVREERELVLDPAVFTALRRRLPRITRVEIQLKRGRYRNELTRFRYDAVLHLDGSGAAPGPERWLNWRQEGLSLAELKRRLAAEEPAVLGIRGVPNARVLGEVRAVELLQREAGVSTVDDLLAAVRGASGGVEPEDFWALGRSFPYDVEVGWAGAEADGSYQVALRHRHKAAGAGDPAVPPAAGEDWSAYVNHPAAEGGERQLAADLRRFLAERFPADQVPESFVMVDRL